MAGQNLAIRVMFAGIDRLSGVLGGIHGATQRAGRAFAETNRALRAQKTELRDVQRQIAAGTGNAAELARRESALAEAIERGTRELDQRRAALSRLAAAQRRFEATQARGDKMIGMGGRAMAAGAVIGAGAGVGVKSAMDMEESMAGVKKVTNMDNSGIARMSSDFLDMSTRIPMAASGLAEIAAAAGAAGVGMDKSGKAMKDQREQLIAFTEDAAKMGVAFDMTAEDAGGTMAKWRTAFAMTQPQVRALGDQVNALTNTFGGKAADVADIVTKIGPLGKVAGLAAPQIAALGSTLNSIGVQNDVAATGIKNMMLTLTKGTAATKGQSAAFKKLGLDAVKVSKDMQTNASGTIVNVMERIGKLRPDQQASMLSELFGTESVGAIAPMLTNLDGLKTRLGLVGDAAKYTGSMQGEFLSRISTTKGATGLAMNALQALNIEMGQKLLPYVVQAAQWVSRTTASVRAWAKANPEAASGVMKLAATVAGLLVSLGAIGAAAGVTTKAWGFIRVGATLLNGPLQSLPKLFSAVRIATMFLARGVMQAGMMMLANPMVLAIVAIGVALGVLGYLVYKNWDAIKAKFFEGVAMLSGAWATIRGAFMAGINAIGSLLPSFKNIGAMMLEGLLSMLSPSRLIGHIVGMAKSAIGAFKGVLGIKSPSRVFAEMGGHLVGGLTMGIDRGSEGPLGRTRRLAGELAAAMAVSAAVPVGVSSMASAVAAGPTSGSRGSGAGGGLGGAGVSQIFNVTIQIAQQPGQDAAALAREVKDIIDREARSRRDASYQDYGE